MTAVAARAARVGPTRPLPLIPPGQASPWRGPCPGGIKGALQAEACPGGMRGSRCVDLTQPSKKYLGGNPRVFDGAQPELPSKDAPPKRQTIQAPFKAAAGEEAETPPPHAGTGAPAPETPGLARAPAPEVPVPVVAPAPDAVAVVGPA